MFFFLGKELSFFALEAKENRKGDVERCADVVFSASIVVNVALLTYFCMLRY